METRNDSALSSDSVRTVYDYVARLVVPSLLLLYGLGFIVANVHLARYGYYSLGLFERRYAFAGFWALVPWLLWFIALRINAGALKAQAKAKGKWQRAITRVLHNYWTMMLFTMAAGLLLGLPLTWLFWVKWYCFAFGTGLIYVFVLSRVELVLRPPAVVSAVTQPLASASHTPTAFVHRLLAAVDWAWSPLLIVYVVFFTALLFPDIPARWGGGAPEHVQLLLDSQASTGVSTLGIPLQSPQLTAPVTLLATTSDDYVLLVDSTRVLYIQRTGVRAVEVAGHFRVPTPTR